MASPRISVIIPTFGRPKYLDETLQSVLAQTCPPAEVIVVDDCSPTPVKLPDDLSVDVRVLRHLRNQGPGAARNTGAVHATGDLVMFLDDDDLIPPGRLKWAVEGLGDARVHVCDVETFYPDGSTRRSNSRVYSGDMRAVFNQGVAPSVGQAVFRREDLLQFDPTLRVSEDTEWWLRMSDRAVFAWSPEVGLRVRSHPESRPGVKDATYLNCRRQVAIRHARDSDRPTRARLYSNVSAAALLAGRRFQTMTWSIRSLAAKPTVLNVKRLMRSFGPLG